MSHDHPVDPTAIRTQFGAIFVSMELSRSSWLITSLSPGNGEKMSTRSLAAGDMPGLLRLFADLERKTAIRTGKTYPIVVIQEAGLDGFWIHRILQGRGIESHVVDAASIAVPRRRRRVKTDKIDGEGLLRVLLAYKRGEPRVCAMVVAPAPEEEDSRRIGRERQTLIAERIRHVNRIKGLLFSQGISDYAPLRRDRRARLAELRTGDGRELPAHMKAQIGRELDRLELLLDQIAAVEAERDAMLAATRRAGSADKPHPVAMLLELKGIGADFAAGLWSEGLYRSFDNRRKLAAYAGLAATPWQSGSIAHEQGISKAGNPRLRTLTIQLAWLWLRHQPQSALAHWFHAQGQRGRKHWRKSAVVALARKLLLALWKYVTHGVVIEGAVMKSPAKPRRANSRAVVAMAA
jgi:transposase